MRLAQRTRETFRSGATEALVTSETTARQFVVLGEDHYRLDAPDSSAILEVDAPPPLMFLSIPRSPGAARARENFPARLSA